ncbi:MAG TPA: MFS transporter [Solirubrobacterales bacterium]|jgi:EmrB/QacA subfamily drug resistance transporter
MKPIDRGTWLALGAMGMAAFVLSNDFSAINVAIPAIEKDFDTSVTTTQWVVNAYALTFGVLLVTGGRLADLFGRRRAFFVGTAIFATFSVLGGAAQTEAELIAMRVVMGVGGALMWPAILGMTFAALPEDRAALGGAIILGVCGLGNAAGPLIGGALTDLLSWRWIFFLNLPVAIIAAFVTWRELHQPRPDVDDTSIDYLGIVTVSVGLVSLLLAFDQSVDWGWGDPRIIGLISVFVVLMVAFALIERRQGNRALVPPDVIQNRDFAYTCGAIVLMSAVFFASLLYLPQLMIKVFGWSPVGAGAGMLPMMATFAAVSFSAGKLADRFGGKPLLVLGALCIVLGAALIAIFSGQESYGPIVPGLAVLGLGVGLFYPTATTAGVTALDESRRSLAGAIIYMAQIAGGSVGLGATTAIFVAASDGATGGSGFVDGIQTAFAVDAAVAVGGFLISAFLIGGRLHMPRIVRPAWAGHSPRGHGP